MIAATWAQIGGRRSRWPQLHQEGIDRPGRTAAAEEVAVTGQDRSVQGEGKRDRCPIGRVARHSPAGVPSMCS